MAVVWPITVGERISDCARKGQPSNVQFSKYQALGNDYLVIEPSQFGPLPAPDRIRMVCDRHYGPGSDGLLLGPLETPVADFGLRLFNPDGGEFEKSGNGLRIFARFLWDQGLVGADPFTIMTPGGAVTAQVHDGGSRVTVDMGQVSFHSRDIPVLGPSRPVVDETLTLGQEELRYCAVTIGNPHCVILDQAVSAEVAQRLGPLVERDPRFPRRTNVQFMRVLDRGAIQIEIWERGVGYTLASGSSSCAAAAAAYKLGLCEAQIAVHMPGGVIDITIAHDWSISMAGAVTRVCSGLMYGEAFASTRAGADR
jgi:diaminopimelate epimerase